ncbi:hypothetical protein ABC855_g1458 [[Candida] zeylanoides]
MVSFTIRKYSKLQNPTNNKATWLHRPERSELSLSFENIDTNTTVLKVMWRLAVFEKVALARNGISGGHPTISVSHKYPYVSVKVMEDCNNVQIRQVSASQQIDAQPFATPGLLTHDFTQFSQQILSQGTQVQLMNLSQPATQFAWPETMDFPDTQYDDTCLSLHEPDVTNITTTELEVDVRDLSALLDEPTDLLKQKIIARLQDPNFERFVNRVDEIVQQESSINRRKLSRK